MSRKNEAGISYSTPNCKKSQLEQQGNADHILGTDCHLYQTDAGHHLQWNHKEPSENIIYFWKEHKDMCTHILNDIKTLTFILGNMLSVKQNTNFYYENN